MSLPYVALVLTLATLPLNSFGLLPWNHIVGMIASLLWCKSMDKVPGDEASAVFWLNLIGFFIYLAGFGYWWYHV
jgi:hypothetical protein